MSTLFTRHVWLIIKILYRRVLHRTVERVHKLYLNMNIYIQTGMYVSGDALIGSVLFVFRTQKGRERQSPCVLFYEPRNLPSCCRRRMAVLSGSGVGFEKSFCSDIPRPHVLSNVFVSRRYVTSKRYKIRTFTNDAITGKHHSVDEEIRLLIRQKYRTSRRK